MKSKEGRVGERWGESQEDFFKQVYFTFSRNTCSSRCVYSNINYS